MECSERRPGWRSQRYESLLTWPALLAWAAASLVYTVPMVVAACGAVAIFGLAVSFYTVSVATATQRRTPPPLQGRVSAATGMATNLAQTFSIAICAILVGPVGYRPLLFTVSAVVTAAALPPLLRPTARVPLPLPRLIDRRGPA